MVTSTTKNLVLWSNPGAQVLLDTESGNDITIGVTLNLDLAQRLVDLIGHNDDLAIDISDAISRSHAARQGFPLLAAPLTTQSYPFQIETEGDLDAQPDGTYALDNSGDLWSWEPQNEDGYRFVSTDGEGFYTTKALARLAPFTLLGRRDR